MSITVNLWGYTFTKEDVYAIVPNLDEGSDQVGLKRGASTLYNPNEIHVISKPVSMGYSRFKKQMVTGVPATKPAKGIPLPCFVREPNGASYAYFILAKCALAPMDAPKGKKYDTAFREAVEAIYVKENDA